MTPNEEALYSSNRRSILVICSLLVMCSSPARVTLFVRESLFFATSNLHSTLRRQLFAIVCAHKSFGNGSFLAHCVSKPRVVSCAREKKNGRTKELHGQQTTSEREYGMVMMVVWEETKESNPR